MQFQAMERPGTHLIKSPHDDLKHFLTFLNNAFTDASRDASVSSELLKKNIRDEFSYIAEGFLNDPIQSVYNTLLSIEDSLLDLVNNWVLQYFVVNKELIDKAFIAKKTNNYLHYTIFLKKDNLKTRSQVKKFIRAYEDTEMNSRMPVIFEFVPNEIKEVLKKEVSSSRFEQIFPA